MICVNVYGSANCCDCSLLITSDDHIEITSHLQKGSRPMEKSMAIEIRIITIDIKIYFLYIYYIIKDYFLFLISLVSFSKTSSFENAPIWPLSRDSKVTLSASISLSPITIQYGILLFFASRTFEPRFSSARSSSARILFSRNMSKTVFDIVL